MYVGYGANRLVCVRDEEALAYAVNRLETLNTREKAVLWHGLREGCTAKELTDWFFSGGFIYKNESR